MAKAKTETETEGVVTETDSFSTPLDPEGDGRITLVTKFPYGEYVKNGKVLVKRTGSSMTREEADKLLKEAPSVVRELKKES